MGRKGYVGSIKRWREEGLLKKTNEDGTESLIETDDEACRVDCYLLGRTKKNSEDKRFYPKKSTEELSKKIVRVICSN